MTMKNERNEYAKAALTGWLASQQSVISESRMAEICFRYADAMINESMRGPNVGSVKPVPVSLCGGKDQTRYPDDIGIMRDPEWMAHRCHELRERWERDREEKRRLSDRVAELHETIRWRSVPDELPPPTDRCADTSANVNVVMEFRDGSRGVAVGCYSHLHRLWSVDGYRKGWAPTLWAPIAPLPPKAGAT